MLQSQCQNWASSSSAAGEYQEPVREQRAITIDIHQHVISTDTLRYPTAPVSGNKSDWSRERPASAQQMIAAMNQAGIAKSVLVQASACYGHDNSYVADSVAAHPDRFTGVFSVDPLAPEVSDKIRYWAGRGLTGMRLFTASTLSNQADWIDDPRSFAVWQTAGELGIPVCMQVTVKDISQFFHILEKFPQVKVVLDHLAKPSLADGPPYAAAADVFRLADYKNLYLKVSAYAVIESCNGKATPESFFPLLVSKFGASRIAWGSNFPAHRGPLLELLAAAQAAVAMLSAADREWIFGKTAVELYPALAGN